MGEFLILGKSDKRAVLANQIITYGGRDSFIEAHVARAAPQWNYFAIGLGTSTPGSADDQLDNEIARFAVTSRGWSSSAWGVGSALSGTAYLKVILPENSGCGDWGEIGIFDTIDNRRIIWRCDANDFSEFSSDGTLSLDSTVRRDGGYSIKCAQIAAGTVSYLTSGASIGIPWPYNRIGTSGYVQFWFRSDVDASALSPMTVRLGPSTVSYYEMGLSYPTLGVWQYFSEQIQSGTVHGTPGTAVHTWDSFVLTHASGTAHNQWLDRITLFAPMGTCMARGTVSYTKNLADPTEIEYSLVINTNP